MNRIKKAIAALGLVGLLYSGMQQPGYAQENKKNSKQAQASILEIKVDEIRVDENHLFGTKEPDKDLYKLIDELSAEYKKFEADKWMEVSFSVIQRLDEIRKYDITKVNNENRRKISTIFNNFGHIFYNRGDYENSIKFRELSVEADPTDQLGYRNLALSYQELAIKTNKKEYFLKSLEFYKKCIEIDPNGRFSGECGRMIKLINEKFLPAAN